MVTPLARHLWARVLHIVRADAMPCCLCGGWQPNPSWQTFSSIPAGHIPHCNCEFVSTAVGPIEDPRRIPYHINSTFQQRVTTIGTSETSLFLCFPVVSVGSLK
jgi:hypothetical protein